MIAYLLMSYACPVYPESLNITILSYLDCDVTYTYLINIVAQ